MLVISLIAALLLSSCAKPDNTSIIGAPGPQGEKGAIGEQGEAGDPGTTIEAITPCPNLAGIPKEVLFKIEGKYYEIRAQGTKVHFVEIQPGNYTTNDGRNCHFTITADYELVY